MGIDEIHSNGLNKWTSSGDVKMGKYCMHCGLTDVLRDSGAKLLVGAVFPFKDDDRAACVTCNGGPSNIAP